MGGRSGGIQRDPGRARRRAAGAVNSRGYPASRHANPIAGDSIADEYANADQYHASVVHADSSAQPDASRASTDGDEHRDANLHSDSSYANDTADSKRNGDVFAQSIDHRLAHTNRDGDVQPTPFDDSCSNDLTRGDAVARSVLYWRSRWPKQSRSTAYNSPTSTWCRQALASTR
jgi:hypothetical protein